MEDVDRGKLLEGSLDIAGTGTTISRIRSLQDGEVLSFSVSGPLSLSRYFGPDGRGNDSTVSIQTIEGLVDIPVAENALSITDDTATLNVPASGRAILKNIAAGTRFIFALHRPAENSERSTLLWTKHPSRRLSSVHTDEASLAILMWQRSNLGNDCTWLG